MVILIVLKIDSNYNQRIAVCKLYSCLASGDELIVFDQCFKEYYNKGKSTMSLLTIFWKNGFHHGKTDLSQLDFGEFPSYFLYDTFFESKMLLCQFRTLTCRLFTFQSLHSYTLQVAFVASWLNSLLHCLDVESLWMLLKKKKTDETHYKSNQMQQMQNFNQKMNEGYCTDIYNDVEWQLSYILILYYWYYLFCQVRLVRGAQKTSLWRILQILS